MDIHEQVNQIATQYDLQHEQQKIRFEFHPRGCTVVIGTTEEHKRELTPHDLLTLGIKSDLLFRMMEAGTIFYF